MKALTKQLQGQAETDSFWSWAGEAQRKDTILVRWGSEVGLKEKTPSWSGGEVRSGRKHSKPPLEAQISLHLNPIQSKGQTLLAWNTSSGFATLFPVYLPRVWLHTPTCCTHTVQIPVSQPLILPFKCAFHGSNPGCPLGCVTLSTAFTSSESHL